MKPTIEELREIYHTTMRCERCGGEIPLLGSPGRRKYCRKCRIEREKERDKIYRERAKAKAKKSKKKEPVEEIAFVEPKKTVEKKEKRVSQIGNIAVEARRAGMSYGRYQALKAMGRL